MRIFRAGATLGRLLWWNAMVVPIAAALFLAAPDERPGERPALYATAGILALLGPVSFLAYLIRWMIVRVGIDRDGLVLSNRWRIGWEEIRDVELRGWRPQPWNPFARLEMSGCAWVVVIFLFKLVLMGLFLLLLAWIFWTVVVPVLVLFSPWHSKVVIELADGSRLVYRDLTDAEHFVESVLRRTGRAGDPLRE
jgi:hypothetical protein